MTREVLIAPERSSSGALSGPLIFLAGPTWTVDWQREAIDLLGRIAPDVHVASPRRPIDPQADFDPGAYAAQVDWESEHLQRAARRGAVLFWLAAERNHRCDRAYAQTTRFELAEWKERHRIDGAPLALGIEPGFTGARYIRRRFAQDCPAVTIRDDLESTCRDALRWCAGR